MASEPNGQGIQSTVDQIKQQVGGTARAVTGVASTLVSDRLKTELTARSARSALELKAFGQAMREASRSLGEQGHETQAAFADDAAQRADQLAAYLASANTDQVVADAKRWSRRANEFVREEPLMFSAAAFAAGLLVIRLLGGAPDES